jgi:hypothetical protein
MFYLLSILLILGSATNLNFPLLEYFCTLRMLTNSNQYRILLIGQRKLPNKQHRPLRNLPTQLPLLTCQINLDQSLPHRICPKK